jgi:hypothetical protein
MFIFDGINYDVEKIKISSSFNSKNEYPSIFSRSLFLNDLIIELNDNNTWCFVKFKRIVLETDFNVSYEFIWMCLNWDFDDVKNCRTRQSILLDDIKKTLDYVLSDNREIISML